MPPQVTVSIDTCRICRTKQSDNNSAAFLRPCDCVEPICKRCFSQLGDTRCTKCNVLYSLPELSSDILIDTMYMAYPSNSEYHPTNECQTEGNFGPYLLCFIIVLFILIVLIAGWWLVNH